MQCYLFIRIQTEVNYLAPNRHTLYPVWMTKATSLDRLCWGHSKTAYDSCGNGSSCRKTKRTKQSELVIPAKTLARNEVYLEANIENKTMFNFTRGPVAQCAGCGPFYYSLIISIIILRFFPLNSADCLGLTGPIVIQTSSTRFSSLCCYFCTFLMV